MSSPTIAVVESMTRAWNAHDLEAFLGHLALDYDSRWPLHPERDFVGVEHVRERWSSNFARMPDFRVQILSIAANDADEVWVELQWFGTLPDGSRFDHQGVIVNTIRDGRIAAARLYLEEMP
ncbi:MAG TPA: nuclear transport factor 2 family protein [Candidatus Limnocylindrales bacterium]|nr:nuclear transport factor 2 family protein [Candidatus Limnocylindrales bacterium]